MQEYFFALGRNPTLSIAEIVSLLSAEKFHYSINNLSSEILIFSTQESFDPVDFIKRSGGTIKIGEIKGWVGLDESETKLEEIFSAKNLLEKFFSKKEGKFHFGISLYEGGGSPQYVAQLEKRLPILCLEIKNNLKEKRIKSGFVRIKERHLSSVSVVKNRLLTEGTEIVLVLTTEKLLIGRTLAVQEFEEFSLRDYDRPKKDKRSGIMPPKLARMMLNLAGLDENGVFHDPFCGSGTILIEAILLGYRNIIGTDISEKAIVDTRTNTVWLFRHFPQVDQKKVSLTIKQLDVRCISNQFPPNSIDVIVTEPYLGPPLYKRPDFNTIQKIFFEISELYLSAFIQIAKILKHGGKIVIIFPAFEIEKKLFFLPVLDKIRNLGFRVKNLLPEAIRKYKVVEITPRDSIIYGAREQFVKREILCFEKF